jgi:DNA topoisomerase-1
MDLVIVESPTKAKTIEKFLGKNYKVRSSYGHIRDLPKSEMGIDIEHNFKPKYVIPTAAKKTVTGLKKDAEKAKTVILATDEDREGEAIAWHLISALKLEKRPIKRIAFHEITKEAIEEALKNPRSLDLNMVDAQQARRILDRLVGYELSPFLWRKVARGLSAGRVQSVAVRFVVEREREIQNFKAEEYWTIDADFKQQTAEQIFEAKLNKIGDKTLEKFDINSKEKAEEILDDLKNVKYTISGIETKETKRNPHPPFITSTLQQEANRRLYFSAKQTMMLAQQLYEGVELGDEGSIGLITYMRTDSVNLSEKFLTEAKSHIASAYGEKYLPDSPRRFQTKSKLAQEAHEAIRPTSVFYEPEKIKQHLNENQYKLYTLIWQRAVASQMSEAIIGSTIVEIEAKKYTFRSNGSIIKFDGFLKIYPTDMKENILPPLEKGEVLDLIKISPNQHFTEPPARYSDASLVKILEEHGIGRPSTYAPTIATITDRGYVERIEGRRLKPKEIAFLVNDLLVKHFPNIVDYEFTAKMEDQLDEIAEGKEKWEPVIKDFYKPFKKNLMQKEEELSKKELTEEASDEVCDKCGSPMIIKTGRYGKFLACSKYPDCKNTKPLGGKDGEPAETTKEVCDKCNHPMIIKEGRYGKFLACSNYPECKNIKPLTKSTGAKCPKCGEGEIVERKTKTGRIFYSCNKYPNCDFALWQRPTGENCPKCKSLLIFAGKDKIKCSSKECDYTKTSE